MTFFNKLKEEYDAIISETKNDKLKDVIQNAMLFVDFVIDFKMPDSPTIDELKEMHNKLRWYETQKKYLDQLSNHEPFLKASKHIEEVEKIYFNNNAPKEWTEQTVSQLESLKSNLELVPCSFCINEINQRIESIRNYEEYKLVYDKALELLPYFVNSSKELELKFDSLAQLDTNESFVYSKLSSDVISTSTVIKNYYAKITPDLPDEEFKNNTQGLIDAFKEFNRIKNSSLQAVENLKVDITVEQTQRYEASYILFSS